MTFLILFHLIPLLSTMFLFCILSHIAHGSTLQSNPMPLRNKMKSRRVWLYLSEAEFVEVEKITELFGPPFKETDIMGMLLGASLRAVKEKNYEFKLPLRLKLDEKPQIANSKG